MDERAPAWLVGIGTDRHRLVAGRALVLCGVTIPHETGPLGHSDGDAVLHAFIDAVLGAAGLGDIGQHFPPHDPEYLDADSAALARAALALVQAAGYRVGNVDVVVQLERPSLSPHKEAMRARLATLAGVPRARVNIKAKTGEGVGLVGRGEVVEALVVVMLQYS